MKSILLILPLLLLGVSPVNAAGWKDLDLESAEISIIGDDSFVTRRRYTYNSMGATEIIIFRGGYLIWRKINSLVYFGNQGDRKLWVAEIFNNSKKISEYGLQNISKDDIKESEDSRQGYTWVSQEKNNMACMIAIGEWGASSRGGDNQINVQVCRPGPKENLEAFVHDLMKRVRIDGGVINKLKASGKYTAPIKQPELKLSKNVPVNFSWEGVGEKLEANISMVAGNNKNKITVKITHENRTCTGHAIYQKGNYKSDLKPEGTWSISCPDQTSAEGSYKSSLPGIGRGVGKDNKGRKIVFVYGENQSMPTDNIKSRLSKLKKLEDAGLITKKEAATKRKAILDSL